MTLAYLPVKQSISNDRLKAKLEEIIAVWLQMRHMPRARPDEDKLAHKRLLKLNVPDTSDICTSVGGVWDAGVFSPCLIKELVQKGYLDMLTDTNDDEPDTEEERIRDKVDQLTKLHHKINQKYIAHHRLERKVRQPKEDEAAETGLVDVRYADERSDKLHPCAEVRTLMEYLSHCLSTHGCQGPPAFYKKFTDETRLPGILLPHRWHITLTYDDENDEKIPLQTVTCKQALRELHYFNAEKEPWLPQVCRSILTIPRRELPWELKSGQHQIRACGRCACRCQVCDCAR